LNITLSKKKDYRIFICNLLGEKIIEIRNQNNQSLNIDMSDLPTGIYFVTFENSLGEKINKKIIKK